MRPAGVSRPIQRARGERRSFSAGPFSLLPLFGILSACDVGARELPEMEDDEPAAEAELEQLAAVGYAEWDEEVVSPAAGVTVYDPARSEPGLFLYADEESAVHLVDSAGAFRHTWHVPGRTQCSYAEPVGDGRVLVLSADEGLSLVDWEGGLVWAVDMNAHHDVAPCADGSFLALEWVEDPDYRGRRVRFDRLVRVTLEGETEVVWDAREARAELGRLHPPLALDTEPPASTASETIYDYHHLNSVEELPQNARGDDPRFRAGNLLLCARNASMLFILDGETLDVVWHYRPGTIDFPHMPTMTRGGNVLFFDNGFHRGWSRVLELDPARARIVWRFPEGRGGPFFTKERGSNQRLANGNTLILESQHGHAMEVTPDHDVVWEYWNPERRGEWRRRIYRLLRVDSALFPASLGPPAAPPPLSR